MPWNTISISDVMDEFSPQEQASFNTLQGQSTTQASILTKVVNSSRGHIKAGGNQLDAAGTVPDQLRNEIIDITIWRWLKKFPQLKALQTDQRRDAYNEAMKTLKEVSKVDSGYKVEVPNAATADSSTPAPVNSIRVVSGNSRQMKRCQTDGL
jgi:hypothetical protein